ncbi:MAG: hypothetical protein HY367_00080 [Candidatus Aenigmarchaeota archaeon]|nr:hypothetical protein [Candidatus Aenigmarchaeota archaeon]
MTSETAQYLEGRARDLIPHIQTRADIFFINKMQEFAEYPDYVVPRKYSKVLERIAEHAEYYKKHKEIRYKIGDEFLAPEELAGKINPAIEKCSPKKGDLNFLSGIIGRLNIGLYLSSEQVVIIERILKRLYQPRSSAGKSMSSESSPPDCSSEKKLSMSLFDADL